MASLPRLDWKKAISWALKDSRDDFFPDIIGLKDLNSPERYEKINARKLPRFDRHPLERIVVPKSHLLRRKAISLPVPFRIVYTALFANLFGDIAPQMPEGVYSYRRYPEVDHDNGAYPYPSNATKNAWLRFKHGFISAMHDGGGRWGVETDITTFFERIPIQRLMESLKSLIPPDRAENYCGTLDLLNRCLLWCSNQGFGIPQNYDASSFFGSVYLLPIDREMARLEGIRYFRWMDDIRFTARTRGEAIAYLHKLQEELERLGLGVNAKKTRLIEPNSDEYMKLLSVDEESRLNSLAGRLDTKHEGTIRETIPLIAEAIKECDEADNDRFLRAYGGRLLEAAEFVEVRDDCLSAIRDYALDGFRKRPQRADWWCRFVAPNVDRGVQQYLVDFLEDANFNCHQWTNMWAVIALCRASEPTESTLKFLRKVSEESSCAPIRAQALVVLGRSGDHFERTRIGDTYITGEAHPLEQRAAIVATQELSIDARDKYYSLAKSIDTDLEVLCEYLLEYDGCQYGSHGFPRRNCLPEPASLPAPEYTASGFIGGQWRSFGVRSRSYADYE